MKVLIAVDGGETSERVFAAVGPWARATSADVHLLAVLHPKDVHGTMAPTGFTHSVTPQGTATGTLMHAEEPVMHAAEDRSQAFARLTVEFESRLRELARRHLAGLQLTTSVEQSEKTDHEIVRTAAAHGAALITMGSHGRAGVARAILGSVAEAVVRRSPVPVLVVGPEAGPGRGGEPLRVVVALDTEPVSEKALANLTGWARGSNSEVHMVSVQGNPTDATAMEGRMTVLASQHLEGVRSTPHVVRAGDAAEVIVATARTLEADLIAMGTHARSGLQRAILGSVAEKVVRQATVPVLLVGPAMH